MIELKCSNQIFRLFDRQQKNKHQQQHEQPKSALPSNSKTFSVIVSQLVVWVNKEPVGRIESYNLNNEMSFSFKNEE